MATLFSASSCGFEREVVGNSMWSFAKMGGVAVETKSFSARETRRREEREVLGR